MGTTNGDWCPECGVFRENADSSSRCPVCSKVVSPSEPSLACNVNLHDRVQLARACQVGFPCPECGVLLIAKPEMARMIAKCPGCQELLTVPSAPSGSADCVTDKSSSPSADPNPQSDKRIRKSIPKAVQHDVWRRDEGRCVECGSNENLEFDHIIPHSRGGSDTERNLQLLCEKCNRSKSAKT